MRDGGGERKMGGAERAQEICGEWRWMVEVAVKHDQ